VYAGARYRQQTFHPKNMAVKLDTVQIDEANINF
jgi:hypothetical protein